MMDINNVTADFSFYSDVYKGKKQEAEIDLNTAALEIYTATYCRAKDNKVTPYQREMIKLAICAQADYNANTLDTADVGIEGVTSYSIGDVSISFDANSESSSSSQSSVCKKARKYLLPTGLLNRCVGG